MRHTALPLFAVLASTALQAQHFARVYGLEGIEEVSSITPLPDGGFLAAGSTNASIVAGDYDCYVVRTAADGQLQWARSFGAGGRELALHTTTTTDGKVMITGNTKSWDPSSPQFFLMRMTTDGVVERLITYGDSSDMGGVGRWVERTSDGGFIIAGEGDVSGVPGWAAFVVRTDAQGDTVWTSFYQTGTYTVNDIHEMADGGFLLSGGNKLLKLGATGDVLWAKQLEQLGGVRSVAPLPDGGAYVSGTAFCADSGSYVMRINNMGEVAWWKIYSNVGLNNLSLERAPDGGFFLAGDYAFPLGLPFLLHGDANGALLWAKRFEGGEYDQLRGLCVAINGDPVACGYVASLGVSNDACIFRTSNDALGCYTLPCAPVVTDAGCALVPLSVIRHRRAPNVRDRVFQVGEGGSVIDACIGEGVSERERPTTALFFDARTRTLQVRGTAGVGQLQLRALNGALVMDRTVNGGTSSVVQVPALESGLYLATWRSATGQEVLKVVVE